MPPWSFLLEVQRCQSGVSGVQSWGKGQSWEPWADRVCAHRAGVDPVSGGDIWKRIYQPSYIQEQYVLTHCSVSTDRSQGLLSRSSTSSESTGSRDVAPEGGSSAPGADVTSQQGQKSLSLCESSTKSAPLPSAPAGTKVRMTMGCRGSWCGNCSWLSWSLTVLLCPGIRPLGWEAECCSLDFKQGSVMDAMRMLLGWFCPTEVRQLGTKQLVP